MSLSRIIKLFFFKNSVTNFDLWHLIYAIFHEYFTLVHRHIESTCTSTFRHISGRSLSFPLEESTVQLCRLQTLIPIYHDTRCFMVDSVYHSSYRFPLGRLTWCWRERNCCKVDSSEKGTFILPCSTVLTSSAWPVSSRRRDA